MTCDEVRELISREGAITSGEANSHVHECPGCQEFWNHWQAVQKELHAMGEEDTPPFLHTRIMAHVQEAAESEHAKGAWLFGLKKLWAGPILVLFLGLLLGGYGLVQVLRPKAPSESVPAGSRPISSKQQTGNEAKAKDASASPDFFKSVAPSSDTARKTAAAPRAPSTPAPAAPADSAGSPQAPAGERPADLNSDMADERKDSLFATPPPPQQKGADEKGAFQPLANRFEERAAPEPAGAPPRESSRPSVTSLSRPKAELSAQPPESEPATSVVCTLSPLMGSGPFISLQLPPSAAPPSGGVWTVVISPDSALRVQDSAGKPMDASLATLRDVIHPLHVPPGSYRLKRIS